MPHPPESLRILESARDDLDSIKNHNPDHATRILDKIADWQDKIQWGRVPQENLTYLAGVQGYNFYREWVGRSGYRVIYEISGDTMTVVAVLPKDDDTYDTSELTRRMDHHAD